MLIPNSIRLTLTMINRDKDKILHPFDKKPIINNETPQIDINNVIDLVIEKTITMINKDLRRNKDMNRRIMPLKIAVNIIRILLNKDLILIQTIIILNIKTPNLKKLHF